MTHLCSVHLETCRSWRPSQVAYGCHKRRGPPFRATKAANATRKDEYLAIFTSYTRRRSQVRVLSRPPHSTLPLKPLQPAQQAVRGPARAQTHRVDGLPILVHGADILHAVAVGANQDHRQLTVRIIQRLALQIPAFALPAVGRRLSQLHHHLRAVVACGQPHVGLIPGREHHPLARQTHRQDVQQDRHRHRRADQLEHALVLRRSHPYPDDQPRRRPFALSRRCRVAPPPPRHLDPPPLERHHHTALVFEFAGQPYDQHRVVHSRYFADVAP